MTTTTVHALDWMRLSNTKPRRTLGVPPGALITIGRLSWQRFHNNRHRFARRDMTLEQLL
jgi:hypothetical protein